MLWQTFGARLAIPLFEGFVRDLAFDEQLRELATLRLTLERHEGSSRELAWLPGGGENPVRFDQRTRSGNICHSPPSRRNVSW
jgi:hypothetical protein